MVYTDVLSSHEYVWIGLRPQLHVSVQNSIFSLIYYANRINVIEGHLTTGVGRVH